MDREYVDEFPVSDLSEHPDNPRRGSTKEIRESIEENEFVGTLIVQRSTNRVLVGNHRLKVLRDMGAGSVPCMVIDVDDTRAKKILLADNRSSDLGMYDDNKLLEVLRELEDLTGTGYTDTDLEQLEEVLSDLDFLEDFSSKDMVSKGSDDGGDLRPEVMPISFNVTPEQRDDIDRGIRNAKSRDDLTNSAEALATICREWLEDNE